MTLEIELKSPALPLPAAASPFREPASWRTAYARRLLVTDALILAVVVYGTQIAWLGMQAPQVSGLAEVDYGIFSALLIAVWLWALALVDSRCDRVIGTGTSEYIRVADASLRVFGGVAVVAFLFRIDVARGYLVIALPLGILALAAGRRLWRGWLVARRRTGSYLARVLLVGSEASVAQIGGELARTPDNGYAVVGACVSGTTASVVPGTTIPIVGDSDSVMAALRRTGADTIAVTGSDDLPPDKVRQISWALEPGREHLVVAPSLIDVAGQRIHTRPVAGVSLIHVETPALSRGQRVGKRVLDVVLALALVVVLSPLMLVVAAIVRGTSPGPALFRQRRVGRAGESFDMWKFRTMHVGAEAQLDGLLDAQGTAAQPLFKVRDDPRVTAVGRTLRRYSIDELPQLFNVLAGSMSLVGPRPQVEAEVRLYSVDARRRLLTRPGMTGLWQIGGRSLLSWQDAIRLDLYYVENWSLLSDLAILARTAKAVASPGDSAL